MDSGPAPRGASRNDEPRGLTTDLRYTFSARETVAPALVGRSQAVIVIRLRLGRTRMMSLVNVIRERLRFPARIDMGGEPFTVFPRVSAAEVRDAEKALGFQLPALLRDIYLNVGN